MGADGTILSELGVERHQGFRLAEIERRGQGPMKKERPPGPGQRWAIRLQSPPSRLQHNLWDGSNSRETPGSVAHAVMLLVNEVSALFGPLSSLLYSVQSRLHQ